MARPWCVSSGFWYSYQLFYGLIASLRQYISYFLFPRHCTENGPKYHFVSFPEGLLLSLLTTSKLLCSAHCVLPGRGWGGWCCRLQHNTGQLYPAAAAVVHSSGNRAAARENRDSDFRKSLIFLNYIFVWYFLCQWYCRSLHVSS